MNVLQYGNDFEKPIPTLTGLTGSARDGSDLDLFDEIHWQVLLDSYLAEERKKVDFWRAKVNRSMISVCISKISPK